MSEGPHDRSSESMICTGPHLITTSLVGRPPEKGSSRGGHASLLPGPPLPHPGPSVVPLGCGHAVDEHYCYPEVKACPRRTSWFRRFDRWISGAMRGVLGAACVPSSVLCASHVCVPLSLACVCCSCIILQYIQPKS